MSFPTFQSVSAWLKKSDVHAMNCGNVRTSRVAIKATPTDVAKIMFKVVRENETAGRPDRWKKSEKKGEVRRGK